MNTEFEDFIKDITRKAGDKILEMRGKSEILKSKAYEGDIVTDADMASHKIIVEAIKAKFPDHGIISEEDDERPEDTEYIWIIDPLDGTKNFSAGMPLFGVFVALTKNKEVIMSATYMPALEEFYFAEKGKGAYLNDKRIYCSKREELKGSYGCAAAMITDMARFLDKYSKYDKNNWVADFGCTIYNTSLVIKGALDWYFASGGSYVWDNAAPSLLLREAGCKVTTPEGKEWTLEDPDMVAANPFLHAQLIRIIKGE